MVLRSLRGVIKFLDGKLNFEKLRKNSIDLFTVF